MSSEIANKCLAELIGTCWLTLGGCGTAVIAASFPLVGVGLLATILGGADGGVLYHWLSEEPSAQVTRPQA